ncbi:MAG: hypothetical protein IKJ22_02890 [Paludibacteraceae bacterium]|nr:hypothetical protein [Paludibacteraceae bacterium]MBR3871672.1 hypothetical protein [Paludibacteraceae bacterium]
MNRKLLIVTFVMCILALAASVYVCVVTPDTTSYALVAFFLLAVVFYFFQLRKK